MNNLSATLVGLLLLLVIAGAVQQWPKLGRVLVGVAAFSFVVCVIILIVRGDFFQPSGLDAEDDNGCDQVMVC